MLAVLLAAPALLAACGESGDSGASGTQPVSPSNTPAPSQSALQGATGDADAVAQMRDAFVTAANEQVAELETMLDNLRVKAEASDAAQSLKQLVSEAETSLRTIRADIQELQSAAGDQFDALSAKIGDAIETLNTKLTEAAGG